MASKGGGSRATGTDGSDHGFRQRVDTKYQKAAAARKSLKKTLLGLVAYYPLMLAFSLMPSFAKGRVGARGGPWPLAIAAGGVGWLGVSVKGVRYEVEGEGVRAWMMRVAWAWTGAQRNETVLGLYTLTPRP
jgi:hypothetical protein